MFFKRMNSQKLQSSVQFSGESELFVKNGNHEVNGDGDSELGLYRVGTGSEVVLDA